MQKVECYFQKVKMKPEAGELKYFHSLFPYFLIPEFLIPFLIFFQWKSYCQKMKMKPEAGRFETPKSENLLLVKTERS